MRRRPHTAGDENVAASIRQCACRLNEAAAKHQGGHLSIRINGVSTTCFNEVAANTAVAARYKAMKEGCTFALQ